MAEPMQTDDFLFSPSGLAEIRKMIREHGNLFSDTQCKLCNAILNSESQMLTHYQSKKHANKARRHFSLKDEKEEPVKKVKTSNNEDCDNGVTDRMKACPLCNMTFTSPVIAESHYQGKVHAKKLKMKTAEKQTPVAAPQTAKAKEKPAAVSSGAAAVSSGITEADKSNPERYCSTCKASFNNPLMSQQHYEGKKHKKLMARFQLIESYGSAIAPASTQKGYSCTICNIAVNSVEQYQSHITGTKHKNQMKKSGRNPEEDQLPAEQPQDDSNQCTSADDQLAPGENQFAVGDDEYAPVDQEFAPGDGGQYGAEDGRYAEYTTEYTEFSEKFQYA